MTDELDFWSRRKARVVAEEDARKKSDKEALEQKQQADLEQKTDEEVLRILELKDPDMMQAGDDFSVFLKNNIPERLRRRALRKLWCSNPVLANVDGLVDYGEDFTDSAIVVENLQTAYQIGTGMIRSVMKSKNENEIHQSGLQHECGGIDDIQEKDILEDQHKEPNQNKNPCLSDDEARIEAEFVEEQQHSRDEQS